jgi:nucleoside-diphosphate-sugar epimerase
VSRPAYDAAFREAICARERARLRGFASRTQYAPAHANPRAQPMRVMVTGGTGFTGSHTVRALVAAGHHVRLLVRDRDKVKRVFAPHGFVPSDVVVGDVVEEASVADAMRGCDAVFHAAALVDLRRKMAQRVLDTNAAGVERVVVGGAKRGLPSIVYVSSMSVFFQPGPAITPESPIVDATTAYGRSKVEGERVVRRLQEGGAPIRISYPAGILGPDDPGMTDANRALWAWIAQLSVDTDGGFQPVDVRDVAALHVKLLESPPGPHRYAAASPMLSWAENYATIERVTGHKLRRRVAISGAGMRRLGRAGDFVKGFVDFAFPLTLDSMVYATQWPGVDASRTTRELGVHFRGAGETYADAIRWMHRAGHLPAKLVGRLAG